MTEAATWTEDRVERLKKLWSEGFSASQIAAELGRVTRNAVIGKVHRLGLSGRAKTSPPANAAPRPRKPAAPRPAPAAFAPPRSINSNSLPALRGDGLSQVTSVPAEVEIPVSQRVTIMELRENMCRWPLGDPTSQEFRYCGARAEPGQPYCTAHCRIAYQPAAERRRERDQDRRQPARA